MTSDCVREEEEGGDQSMCHPARAGPLGSQEGERRDLGPEERARGSEMGRGWRAGVWPLLQAQGFSCTLHLITIG